MNAEVALPEWPSTSMGLPTVRPFLDPTQRASEVLFGLIMVLAYTGSISVLESGKESIDSVLIGAIGCNLAWAIVDAAMYVISMFAERARALMTVRTLGHTRNPDVARRLVARLIPPSLADLLTDREFEALRWRLAGHDEPYAGLRYEDYMAAVGVFLFVFLSTFPVVVPFVVMHDAESALHVSQGIAMAMLYIAGWYVGRHTGRPPWRTGLTMVLLGAALTTLTYVLGG